MTMSIGDAAAQQLGHDVGGVADHADRTAPGRSALAASARSTRVVEVVGHLVEVAVLDAALQPGRVDVDDQARRRRSW